MQEASSSIRCAPKARLSNTSMSTSVFTWLLASCVTTFIPASRACFNTSSSASGEFGTTVIAAGFSAISFRIISACFCGSASAAPVIVASTPVWAANCLMPCSMRSNQTIPMRFTTVTILISPGCGLRSLPACAVDKRNRQEKAMNARTTVSTRFEFNIAFSVLETAR